MGLLEVVFVVLTLNEGHQQRASVHSNISSKGQLGAIGRSGGGEDLSSILARPCSPLFHSHFGRTFQGGRHRWRRTRVESVCTDLRVSAASGNKSCWNERTSLPEQWVELMEGAASQVRQHFWGTLRKVTTN